MSTSLKQFEVKAKRCRMSSIVQTTSDKQRRINVITDAEPATSHALCESVALGKAKLQYFFR